MTHSLADVQNDISAACSSSPEPIYFVGHSIENDFKALHIYYNHVIDTSFLYPHPDGGSRKLSLRRLCKDFLGMNIQQQKRDKQGHNSVEVRDVN